MSMPSFLYHGTSTGYFDQILQDGLCPSLPQVWPDPGSYLCFADELVIAWHHAECMAEWDSGTLERDCEPIVFIIPIERFTRSAFCLDRNFVRLAPSSGRAVGKPLPKRQWNWYALLKHAGAVGYRKNVKVLPADLVRAPADYLDVSEDGGIAVPQAFHREVLKFIGQEQMA